MKHTNIMTLLLLTILVVGCKENEADKEAIINKAIEETTVNEVPHQSDKYFSQALASLKEENRQVASKQIIQGVDALMKESKDVSGLYKLNLEKSIAQLRQIAKTLAENNDVYEETFKEAVANAEINVAHKYLATDGVYVLTPKEKVHDTWLHKIFDTNLKNLEARGTNQLKDDAKKSEDELIIEGKKLKEDYEAWKKRVEAHNKKTEAHFKEHHPEYVYPMGVIPLF